jgi:hypothetical protein
MRASDLTPEEQAAHYERIRQTLERVDELNAELAERAAQRQRDGTDFEERAERRQYEESLRAASHQPEPVPPIRRAPESPVQQQDWSGWNRWADKKIGDALMNFADALGEEVARINKEERARLRGEFKAAIEALRADITKSEVAVTELLLEQEKRIAAIERRFNKPRLVGGGSDAA